MAKPSLSKSVARLFILITASASLLSAQAQKPRLTLDEFFNSVSIDHVRLSPDGHSLVDQEVEIGFRSIAVPLRRLDGMVIAALNIGVHSERSPLATMHKTFLPKLAEAASRLQPQLI